MIDAGAAAWRPPPQPFTRAAPRVGRRPLCSGVMPTTDFHLAQVNVARARGQPDEPVMAEFMAVLPEINALAERSPGFVWRLQTEDGDATAIRPYGDPLILINLSLWRDLDALREYVFRSDHAGYMRRRREWFERFERVYLALWWVPAGHIPTIGEAVERLAHLEAHGPTSVAFGFAQPFGPDGRPLPRGTAVGDACPAG